MSTDETKQQIAVMQAYVDGEKIECLDCYDEESEFIALDNPQWNWIYFDYRVEVIEQPRLVWIKNDGNRPDFKKYIVKFGNGIILSNDFTSRGFSFDLDDSNAIIEYMIIE